jgi:hypothetical protein
MEYGAWSLPSIPLDEFFYDIYFDDILEMLASLNLVHGYKLFSVTLF